MSQKEAVLKPIDGQQIAGQLLKLAKIGGVPHDSSPDHPKHYGSNRLALSDDDREARDDFVSPLMEDAGMQIIGDHPVALVGRYAGTDPSLKPVMIPSHTDTVPYGDIYDGTLGVLGGIAAVKAIDQAGLRPKRDVLVVALTGEESSRFGMALFGSRALFHGLTEAELGSHKPGDLTIGEVLGEKDSKIVKSPAFGPNGVDFPTPYASIELHVEQDRKLVDAEIDLGVVENIAAPVRYSTKIGDSSLTFETSSYEHNRYFELQVQGSADHSGATPMGAKDRADGLLETAIILDDLIGSTEDGSAIALGAIEIEEQAMNKVPGFVTAKLRIGANSKSSIDHLTAELRYGVEGRNFIHGATKDKFQTSSIKLNVIDEAEAGDFFSQEEMVARQKTAFNLIEAVNLAAKDHADQKCVGTVGTFDVSSGGVISLGIDLRGMELAPRDSMVAQIQKDMSSGKYPNEGFRGLGEVLPGSGDAPVKLSGGLVHLASQTIAEDVPGASFIKMDSTAGHDTQNVIRAGIPAVMIFAQSKDGIAHNPNAYTSPENIGKAVSALAAIVLRLANEPDEQSSLTT